MVHHWVVFGVIIAHVFKVGMPMDSKLFACNLIGNPEVTHLHGTGALAFYGVVGNAGCGGVVAVDLSRGLRMAEFMENESNDAPFFGIHK